MTRSAKNKNASSMTVSEWSDGADGRPTERQAGSGDASRPPLQGDVEEKDFVTVAGEALRSTVDAATTQASELFANVSDELSETIGKEKQRGADSVLGIAQAITIAAEELDQQSPGLAGNLKKAARSIESLSEGIKSRNLRELSDEVGNLARRQPGIFFAGAVIAGFTLARFLRSTPPSPSPPQSPLSGGVAGA